MADLYDEFENSKHFHSGRIDRRSADTLLGLAAGLTVDGVVSTAGAVFLKDWLETNLGHLDDPVINLLRHRLESISRAGTVDDKESDELVNLLRGFSGLRTYIPKTSDRPHETPAARATPTDLPLDTPEPDLVWSERVFVFTGIMAYGPRKDCESLVEDKGGIIGSGINRKTNYLVIGSSGNEQWRHSSYGTKIMKAVELRESGSSIAIISEEHWQRVLFG